MSIEITAFGVAFLPICLLAMRNLDRLLCLTLIASAFEAASVVNITFGGTSFGLQPAYASGALLCLMTALRYAADRRLAAATALRFITPLALFVGYAALSAYALPRLFQDSVAVWPQRLDPNAPFSVPLAPSSGNTTQTLYLILAFGIFLSTLLRCQDNRKLTRTLLETYLICSLIVVALGYWQFAARLAGLPFPEDFLHSNPTYAMFRNADLGGLPRLTGPMTEAAGLAYFLSGTLYTTAWLFIVGSGRLWFTTLLLCLTAALLVLTTSTTGYVAAAIGPVFALLFSLGAGRAVFQRLLLVSAGGLVLLLIAFYLVPLLSPHAYDRVLSVVDATSSKSASISYEERTGKDIDSLLLMTRTYGLGAGWGSVRASSFLSTLAGSTGAWGIGLILLFAGRVRRLVKSTTARPSADPTELMVSQGLIASLIGILVAAAIAAPNLNYVGFWINLGAVVGFALSSARESAASQQRAPSQLRPVAAATDAAR